ncbi:uncharacterized protein BO88DRAFT_216811 [Aspergillus vadensis CBS 113365]|uniref:Secreted protein n=1 Tax=Aspergillus vadensis (strain CBS 113365 / IMI 142717 / IBT 24658) TaxID=1448311 RepID=A0A319BJN6_ASPVC|nr:hypothetical protein BO88DRAFT_216811 [Aspergillus vadensis CBS 113365]PYH72474.1 hypothetical protein BO88DRAFT_216811 [Aspergillus vadensis CBS 113365]
MYLHLSCSPSRSPSSRFFCFFFSFLFLLTWTGGLDVHPARGRIFPASREDVSKMEFSHSIDWGSCGQEHCMRIGRNPPASSRQWLLIIMNNPDVRSSSSGAAEARQLIHRGSFFSPLLTYILLTYPFSKPVLEIPEQIRIPTIRTAHTIPYKYRHHTYPPPSLCRYPQ